MELPTAADVAVDAALLRMLELHESGRPDQWRTLDTLMAGAPEPVRAWARRHRRRIGDTATARGWAGCRASLDPAGEVFRLSPPGADQARAVRALAQGPQRKARVREHVFAYIHAMSERTGTLRVHLAPINQTPLGWIGAKAITRHETTRACALLAGQGLVRIELTLITGDTEFVVLTPAGLTAAEHHGGSYHRWERSSHHTQGGSMVHVHLNNSPSAQVNTAGTVHGDNTQTATTVTAQPPDLAGLCQELRAAAPTLSLDQDDRAELIEQVERVEGAAAAPETMVAKLKRWLAAISELLSGDTTGNALHLLGEVAAALSWLQGLAAPTGLV
ncbi:hypothetical protein ABZ234_08505 [Nocardiopsis sp. NPDC006198]|uniref:hypothetical protein n=1 Tax=Nocardiopsis sp. NPDC006198 TaxID=3154472 RepID=UPI0033A18207